MSDEYKQVRGSIESISDSTGTTEELKEVATEVKELGTVDASFPRGQLYLLEDEVVFAQSINESTVMNYANNLLSIGPISPLQTLGIYKPYKTSLEDAGQYAGTWRLPYSEIEAISLLSKANGYEIFLRRAGDSGHLYRIRNEEGTDYIGFRWLSSPNHDTAVQMAGELFDQAMRYGGVEEFNPGGHFPGRTKQIEFDKGKSKYADKEPIDQSTSSPNKDAEIDDTNASSRASHADDSGEQGVAESNKQNKTTSKNTSVDESSQPNAVDVDSETQSVDTDTQNGTNTEVTPQSTESTTTKRRWSVLAMGIILLALPPIVPMMSGGLLLTNSSLIPIIGVIGIVGMLTTLFGIYRIIRY